MLWWSLWKTLNILIALICCLYCWVWRGIFLHSFTRIFFFFFWGALLDLGNEHWCTPNKFKTKSGEWFFTWAKRNHDICLNMSKEKPPHRFYMSKEKPRYRFYMSKETQRYCFYMSKEKPRYRFYMSKEQPRYHLYKSKEKPRYRFYKSKEKPQYRFYMSKEKPRYRFN